MASVPGEAAPPVAEVTSKLAGISTNGDGGKDSVEPPLGEGAKATAEPSASAPPPNLSATPQGTPSASGLFDGLFSTVQELSKQTTTALGTFGNTVVNLGTHATKLSTSQEAAEEQWREHFPESTGESSAEERLRAFFFCCLLTSVGPCQGTLFVTDHTLCFLSDEELEYNVTEFETDESHYRARIPLDNVSGIAPASNPENDTDKYIRVATEDKFAFWFTGFLNYDSAFAHILAVLQDCHDGSGGILVQ